VIQAQSADFAAYRQRLAGGVTGPARRRPGTARPRASVQARVDDRKQGLRLRPDKLTLSQGSAKAGAPEAKIAREPSARTRRPAWPNCRATSRT
jgi:pilus assembly protein FimV